MTCQEKSRIDSQLRRLDGALETLSSSVASMASEHRSLKSELEGLKDLKEQAGHASWVGSLKTETYTILIKTHQSCTILIYTNQHESILITSTYRSYRSYRNIFDTDVPHDHPLGRTRMAEWPCSNQLV